MHLYIRLLNLLLLFSFTVKAQTTVIIDASIKYQTIQGFGASDAWNTEPVGKYWSVSVKNEITQKLFSKTFDSNGNPEGIGLSRWRFNIGAGSAEQGNASNIDMPERRVECFLNQDSTYNWNKQAGQQWFLNQAKKYGVEQLVGFVNIPPRFYTKNGRTNSDNIDVYGSTNLKDGYYDDFARFLTSVLKHFEDSAIHFAQISPVNEPQYAWNNGQEGCPWANPEIKQLVGELNNSLIENHLSTKILLAEASNFNDLYQSNGNAEKCNQIYKFFNVSRPEYIGGYSQILQGLGGHSYWTDSDDNTLRTTRENIFSRSNELGGIELYQTEYCLLSKDFNDYLTNSVFLGKMIYADLAIANVSIWDYWTSLERERWSQKNRFYLIRLLPNGGDYADLSAGGTVSVDKNLWVLGNYSFFVRPGYKRIETTGASDLSGLMGTSFISPDSSKIVVVYVNWGTSSVSITQKFNNLPDGLKVKDITPFVTDVDNDLRIKSKISENTSFLLTAQSVTTMVVNLDKISSATNQLNDNSKLEIFPNPSHGLFQVNSNLPLMGNPHVIVKDISGKVVFDNPFNTSRSFTIDLSDKPSGIYFFNFQNRIQKIVKQ